MLTFLLVIKIKPNKHIIDAKLEVDLLMFTPLLTKEFPKTYVLL